jgi:hypothetical protein
MDDANICIDVYYKDETLLVNQKAMAELFDAKLPAI